MRFIPKKLRNYQNVCEYNWLIHLIIVEFLEKCAQKYVSGVMVDIGCGLKPYEELFSPFVTNHIGVDLESSPHGISKVDVLGSAYKTNISDSFCDVVLCTEVLEHLEEPSDAIQEMIRILKPGGILILTVPLFWHVHEGPRDFYRYTEFGLGYLFEKCGFEIVEINPLTGFIVTFTQLSIYFLSPCRKILILNEISRFFNWIIQCFAYAINKYDCSKGFTNHYGVVAMKPKVTR
jgi:SAM-dependent methyltransferase